jgi:hypothetical protein
VPKPIFRLSARGRWIVWRARVGGSIHRWLRFATGLFVSALFATGLGVAAAQDQPGADLTVAGIRIRTREGRVYEGLLQSGPTGGDLQVKNTEETLVVPEESVETRQPVRLDLRRVYRPSELLEILEGRGMPSSGEGFDRMEAGLLRAKLRERAVSAFRMAEILRHPEGAEAALLVQLARLRDRVEDLAIRRTVFQARESCLSGDYGLALAQLGELEKSIGGEPGALAML